MDQKFIDKNKAEVEKMKILYDDDIIQTHPALRKRAIDPRLGGGEFTDKWGCRFREVPDGVGSHPNLIDGNRDTIRGEVVELFSMFEANKGKYIACPCNTIMPETPVENVWSLLEAIREFGDYNRYGTGEATYSRRRNR